MIGSANKLCFYHILSLLILVSLSLKITDQKKIENYNHFLELYCRSFRSCSECHSASYACAWCHETGCTSLPQHCAAAAGALPRPRPRRGLPPLPPRCPEIGAARIISVPANQRHLIKFNIRSDNLFLNQRSVVCEINIEQRKHQVSGFIIKNVVYCDPVVLKSKHAIIFGQLRLFWGGAEPYSNEMEVVVYRCSRLAGACTECRALRRGFECGWCADSGTCTTLHECPRQNRPWLNKNVTCVL